MFVPKLATLYGVLLIAATDAFPGMIPNSARQDIPISETEPIRLSSVSGGATSLPATNTASLPVRPDPSTPVASISSLSTPDTTNQPENAGAGPTVSMPDGPTMTYDTTRMVQTPETATESAAETISLAPGGLSMTA